MRITLLFPYPLYDREARLKILKTCLENAKHQHESYYKDLSRALDDVDFVYRPEMPKNMCTLVIIDKNRIKAHLDLQFPTYVAVA